MMSNSKNMILLLLMLLSAGLGFAMRPTIVIADELPPIDLKTMVPAAFGEWQEDTNQASQILDPERQATIQLLYSQTLSRTYVNREGYSIMLSIAYGKNQSNALQLHKPDLCYPAQGFTVTATRPTTVNIFSRPISAVQLETNLGLRFEPLTYWTVVGDQVTTTSMNKKIAEMRYALMGRIPDGMLVRISSIDRNAQKAYAMQKQFSTDMVAAIAPEHRSRFVGNPATQ